VRFRRTRRITSSLHRIILRVFVEYMEGNFTYFENIQTESACELKIPGIKLCIFTGHMTVT
jgi:hypothetical protein